MATKTEKSTEVVPASATSVVHRDELQAVIAKAVTEMKQTDFDAEQQMLDILEANSIEELLNATTVLHLADLIGTPITIHGATLGDSKFEDSLLPMYAVIRAEFDDGSRQLITCGAAQVIGVLVAAQAKGWFPFRCAASSIVAASGNTVIKLENPPERVRR